MSDALVYIAYGIFAAYGAGLVIAIIYLCWRICQVLGGGNGLL